MDMLLAPLSNPPSPPATSHSSTPLTLGTKPISSSPFHNFLFNLVFDLRLRCYFSVHLVTYSTVYLPLVLPKSLAELYNATIFLTYAPKYVAVRLEKKSPR